MKLIINISKIESGAYYISYFINNILFSKGKGSLRGGAEAESPHELRKVCWNICYENVDNYIKLVNSKISPIDSCLFEELENKVDNFKRLYYFNRI